MDVLVPVDGTESSHRALSFAIDFADRFDASLHVVHVSDAETDATDQILDAARDRLGDAGVDDTPELILDERIGVRTAAHVGERIVDLVEERGYDHVVMGHSEGGDVGRAIVGSAAEKVVRSESAPVTIVP
ncbi:universal stress protein [Salinirarus marinus]|uniref:universal stress protein n=1 Tax=Salinirarus marinus TaxID=3068310 RepID=UPI003C6BE3AB